MQPSTAYNPSSEMIFSESTVAKLMRNVYLWMTLALIVTGMSAYLVASSPVIYHVLGSSVTFWILVIAELGIVFYLSDSIQKISFTTASILFIVYSLLNGVILSSIFIVYTFESITNVFFITAGTFGAMALVGSFIKKDLSGLGRFFLMSLIGIIIATVVNMFFENSVLGTLINYIGVLLFVGLTAYDAQKIKNMLYMYGTDINDDTKKYALLGSLQLYLDFINLFLYLLRIFGNRRN
ncbi:MAG: Bax inhibitor-1/YccA family protein [Bacteroidaceae bacterium]|nr:Bax inhibitor-1/YccA family protein [Bacteroidaceae bacterium]